MVPATITSVLPLRAVEGGRITIEGSGFPLDPSLSVSIDDVPARVSFASSGRIVILVPGELDGGRSAIRVSGTPGETAYVSIAHRWATGLHQVDNPVFDPLGNLFVTYSGSRGQEAPVSVFRVTPSGAREPFGSGIVNATSLAIGPDGRLYVSSRFEGAVYRLDDAGGREQVGAELGVACGLAFDPDGGLYVGDRSGTIFLVRDGRTSVFATLPSSVAAFHLAMSREGELFVAGPTLNACDQIFRIDRRGEVDVLGTVFGRPQGLAFAPDGTLHVVEALAGSSGIYRFATLDSEPELIVSAAALVGLAFGPRGEMVVASNDTAYRFS
jgi:sugar lactone lactonase YvrE